MGDIGVIAGIAGWSAAVPAGVVNVPHLVLSAAARTHGFAETGRQVERL